MYLRYIFNAKLTEYFMRFELFMGGVSVIDVYMEEDMICIEMPHMTIHSDRETGFIKRASNERIRCFTSDESIPYTIAIHNMIFKPIQGCSTMKMLITYSV